LFDLNGREGKQRGTAIAGGAHRRTGDGRTGRRRGWIGSTTTNTPVPVAPRIKAGRRRPLQRGGGELRWSSDPAIPASLRATEGSGRTRGARGSQRWLQIGLGWSEMRWRRSGREAELLAGVGAEELPDSASTLWETIEKEGRSWVKRGEAEGPLNRGSRGGRAGSRHCRAVASSTASLAAGCPSRRGLRST
jgi:hypothetical protein